MTDLLLYAGYDYILQLFGFRGRLNSHCSLSIVAKPTASYNLLTIGQNSQTDFNFDGATLAVSATLYKRRHTRTIADSELVGAAAKTMLQGAVTNNDLNAGHQTWDNGDPFQCLRIADAQQSFTLFGDVFSHSSSAPGPFYDPNFLASGSKKPTFSGSKTTTYPELWQLDVTVSGPIGTSEYKLANRQIVGFSGNTYYGRGSVFPFYNLVERAFPGFHDGNARYNQVLKSQTEIIFWDTSGVTLLNVLSGDYQNFDSGTTPALAATDVGQCYYRSSNNSIYVACRATGLYQIDLTGNTVANLNGTACYGVTEANGKIYAAFNGRLANEDDLTVARTFTITELTTDWSLITGLVGDPDHPDFRLAIALDRQDFYWWSETLTGGANADTGVGTEVIRAVSVTRVPAHQDIWYVRPGMGSNSYSFSFGANSRIAVLSNSQAAILNPFLGDRFLINPDNSSKAEIIEIDSAGGFNVVVAGDSSDISWLLLNTGYTYHHLGKGVFIRLDYTNLTKNINPHYFYAAVPNRWDGHLNPLIWDTYAWDSGSSAWVQETWTWDEVTKTWNQPAGAGKPTHSTAEALVDGISVQWDELDGSNPVDLLAGDYYTVDIFTGGAIKNNVTSWDFSLMLYSKPISEGSLSATIPASSPYELYVPEAPLGSTPNANWIALDSDAPRYSHTLNIDGYANPATLIEGGGAAPGANEIRVNSDGKLEFNSADAGKGVSGTYRWILHESY